MMGSHALKFGVDFIHEPVLSGAFASTPETLAKYINDPTYYVQNPGVFGSFSQNVQRLGLYAEDSWRVSHNLTVNYGLRYQTTFGLFEASGVSQAANPSFPLLPSLGYPEAVPHDDRKQIAPRIGIAYSPGRDEKTVIRAGFGLYFDDLAQNGWGTAFEAVNLNSAAPPSLIDPNYKTPYAIHITGGAQHAFNEHWMASADYVHEQGNHGYRAFPYPAASVYESNNRSSYNGLMLHVQGNLRRVSLVANYTLSKAQTWGCLLGELFDYVDGVCTAQSGPNAGQLDAFGPGDYGPSGEDVRNRFVFAGTAHLPGGFELSSITQVESARPITITTADNSGRIFVNGAYTSLDEFRGTPYIQSDLRVTRPFKIGERWQINPFAEFFNLFNRNNPGANYAVNIVQIPGVETDPMNPNNVIGICNPNCVPITSLKQLEIPEGALGDFFGPGTTVGIPFAAQLGVRVTF
jgi:outer membrane receptor protein involved in Fe transport